MDARGSLPHQVLARMTKGYALPVQEGLAVHRKPSYTPGPCHSHRDLALCFVVAVVCFETESLLFVLRQTGSLYLASWP